MGFPIRLNDYNNGEMDCCIGDPNLDAMYLSMMLEQAGAQEVDLFISSIGGNAFVALDMYDMLKKQGNTTARIGALAASSASVVAMGAKHIIMSKNALMMIHKPKVPSGGDADELTRDIQMLNTVQSRISQIYQDKTGLDEVTVNSLINATTWMTAEQALDLGFIDEIDDYNEKEVTNIAQMLKYADHAAPVVYKRVINKINIPSTKTKEQSIMGELSEKALKVLNKVALFFNNSEVKTVTNKGTLVSYQPLAKGVKVLNEAGEEPAKDDEYTVDNAGKKTVLNVKDGVIDSMDDDTETEDTGDAEEVENKVVLNRHSIVVTNKGDVKTVVNLLKKIEVQNGLLLEAKTSIGELTVENKLTREEIAASIRSEFKPEGSSRSTKGVVNKAPAFMPTSEVAKNSVKRSVQTNPDKA